MTENQPKPVGPPSLLTEETRRKIEEVAALDGTVEEMAYYCGVHRSTVHRWFKENPELYDRVEALRQRPILAARQEVVGGIKGDKDFAMRYLERKKPKEFMPNAKLNIAATVETTTPEMSKAIEAVKEEYEAKLRQALAAPEDGALVLGEGEVQKVEDALTNDPTASSKSIEEILEK